MKSDCDNQSWFLITCMVPQLLVDTVLATIRVLVHEVSQRFSQVCATILHVDSICICMTVYLLLQCLYNIVPQFGRAGSRPVSSLTISIFLFPHPVIPLLYSDNRICFTGSENKPCLPLSHLCGGIRFRIKVTLTVLIIVEKNFLMFLYVRLQTET